MKVAVYYNNHDIRIEERPVPEIGVGEILIEVRSSGICGTDVMEWYRTKKGPRVLGHEISGEIVQSRSDKFKEGQRVFVSHHVPCGECSYCKAGNHTACEFLHKGNYEPGGFSEYIRVPKENVDVGTYVLPESVSNEEGTMIEPLACVVRGHRVIGLEKHHTVLVLGCGISGLLNIQLAKLKGCRVVAVDIDGYRKAKAKDFGADEVCDAREKFDVRAQRVVICTGAYPAFMQAFEKVDRKGTVLLFAIPDKNIEIPTPEFWRNEFSLVSSYGAAPQDLKEALQLIVDKKIDINDMITHIFPLEEIQKAFDVVVQAKDSLKVVLKPLSQAAAK